MRGLLAIPRILVCPQCRTTFESQRGNKRFCSVSCKSKYTEAKRPKSRKKIHPMVCGMCGEEFMGKLHQRFCSRHCVAKHSWANGKLSVKSYAKGKDHTNWKGGPLHTKLRKYGISGSDYKEMVTKQNNKCAICGKEPKGFHKRLGVDHNHVTGEIRGLLCPNCNTAIGLFQDNPDLLSKAISYLTNNATTIRKVV